MSKERLQQIQSLITQEITEAESGGGEQANCDKEKSLLKGISAVNDSALGELDFINEFAGGVALTNGRSLPELLFRVKALLDRVRLGTSQYAADNTIVGDSSVGLDPVD